MTSLAAVPSAREIRETVRASDILGRDIARRYELLEEAAYSYSTAKDGSGGFDPESDRIGDLALDGLDPTADGRIGSRVGPRRHLELAANDVRKAMVALQQAREQLIAAEREERRRSAIGSGQTWDHGTAIAVSESWARQSPGGNARAERRERRRAGD